MRIFLISFSLFSLLMLGACGSMVKKVDYASGPAAPDDARPTPILFKDIELLLPTGTMIGYQASGHIFCTIPYQPVSRTVLRNALDEKYLKETFHDALESNGYNVVNSIDLAFAQEDEQQRAEYTIRAKVKDVQVDMCKKIAGPYSIIGTNPGTRGELYAAIDWSVYDPLRRTVVYKTRTEGYTKRDLPNEEGLALMFQDAFEMAAHNLAAEDGFYDLIFMGKRPGKGDMGDPHKSRRAPGGYEEERPRQYDRLEEVFIPQRPLSRQPFEKHSRQILQASVMVQKFGHASGFFITDKGHILTTADAVGDGLRTRIVTHGGARLTAEILRVDKARNVALLKLEELPEALTITPLPIRTEIPNIGEDVYAIGTPYDYKSAYRDTVSKGIISAYRTDMKVSGIRENYIQADVNIHRGSEGGLLLDERGNILGLAARAITDDGLGSGLNYFIPIKEALTRLSIAHGSKAMPREYAPTPLIEEE